VLVMTRTSKGRSKKKGRPANASVSSKKPQPVASLPEQGDKTASDRFVKDLLVRGDAAPLTPDGKLPSHATHVIKKRKDDGTAEVERVRYKLF
jgi:hypothetical protein